MYNQATASMQKQDMREQNTQKQEIQEQKGKNVCSVEMSENDTTIERIGKTMNKTMKIEGMMCGHCEARVKKCLEKLEQVEVAEVSHKDGTAVVTLNGELEDAVLVQTVEAQDYKVLGIE